MFGCTGGAAPSGGGGGTPARQYTLGAQFVEKRVVDRLPKALNPSATNLPASVDLTAGCPPVGDQGQMGSCTASATGYCMDTELQNRKRGWNDPSGRSHQASPGYLYARTLEEQERQGAGGACGDGTSMQIAHDVLVREGCSSYATVGYSDASCFFNPTRTDASSFQISSWKAVDTSDRNAVKSELASGSTVAFGAELYDDFMDYMGGYYVGSGRYLGQGGQHAAHALTIIGYDDSQGGGRGAYRIQNSWGTGWGETGRMWMSYSTFENTAFLGIVSDSANVDPNPNPNPDPNPNPEPPPGGPTLSFDNALQFEWGWWTTCIYLYVEFSFDQPVYLDSIAIRDPSGAESERVPYEMWFVSGYAYFYQADWSGQCYAFDPGDYTIMAWGEDLNGNSFGPVSATGYVPPLNVWPWSGAGTVKVRGVNVPARVTSGEIPVAKMGEHQLYGPNRQPCAVSVKAPGA
jgi:hypothetical protein